MVDSASNINESFFFFFLCNIWTVFPKLPSLVGSRFSALSEVVQTFWKRLSRSMAAASRLSRVQRVHVTAQSASVRGGNVRQSRLPVSSVCVCVRARVFVCVRVRAEWFPAPLAVLFSCKSWSIFCRRESGQMQQPLFPPFFPVC